MTTRVLRIVLATTLVGAGLVTSATGATAGDYGAETREIIEAFETVGNLDASIDDRAAALEDGDKLRTILRATPSNIPPFRSVKLSGKIFRGITVHRLHRDAAEVDLGIYVGSSMVTGWQGVAVRDDGRWKMSRSTLCTMLTDWTELRCPGGPKSLDSVYPGPFGVRLRDSNYNDDSVTFPLTFADGSTAELVLPPGAPDAWRAMPRGAFELHRGEDVYLYFHRGRLEARQPVRTYRGAKEDVVLDAMQGLLIRAGDWTISAYAYDLDEASRRLIARHLTGKTTDDGLVELEATGPLTLDAARSTLRTVKSALSTEDTAFPIELTLTRGDAYTLLVVTLGPCPEELQRYSYDDYLAVEQCLPGGNARIAVESTDVTLVMRLLDGARVRKIVRPEPPPTDAAFV